MAKGQGDDITFDKLKHINLEIPGHLEDIQAKEPPKKAKSIEEEPDVIKTSFKIDREVHLALKQYCLMHGEEMAKLVFEQIVKPFLTKEGYYPPRKRDAKLPRE